MFLFARTLVSSIDLQAGFLTRILPRGAFPFDLSNSGLKFASGDFLILGTDTHSGATAAAFYRVPIFCIREKNFADLQSPLFFFQRASVLQFIPPPSTMQEKNSYFKYITIPTSIRIVTKQTPTETPNSQINCLFCLEMTYFKYLSLDENALLISIMLSAWLTVF